MAKKSFLKIKFISCFCICLSQVIFSACSENQSQLDNAIKEVTEIKILSNTSEAEKNSMLAEPDLSYEVPKNSPGIKISLTGYEPADQKIAVLEGSILPAQFKVYNKESGMCVLNGETKIRECTEDGEIKSAVADFSSITAPGIYYMETDILGRSYDFEIKEGAKDELIKAAFDGLRKLHSEDDLNEVCLEDDPDIFIDVSGGWITSKDGSKDVIEACLGLQDILTALDYYPKAFGDDFGYEYSGNSIPDILDEAFYEADWLLKMQNPETGGVYTQVSFLESGEDNEKNFVVFGETTKATAYFCTTMARLSYISEKYDKDYSLKALSAANKAWKCLEANKDLVQSEQYYRAAVEMYRATGYNLYKTVVEDYLKENASKPFESRIALDAAIDYLDSSRGTNVDYCTELMANFMSRTEEKSQASKESRYYVEPGVSDESELLRNTFELIIVDYIISNKEYATIEENYIQYFTGRNPECRICDELAYSPDAYVEFLALVCKVKTVTG